jgi:hypothetical protein
MLVQQSGFDRSGLAGKLFSQPGGTKGIAQRFRPKAREKFTVLKIGGFAQIHKAKTAGVIIKNAMTIAEVPFHMVMGRFGVWGRCLARGHNGKSPGHAQMGNQCFLAAQINQQIFGAPTQVQNLRAGQALAKVLWKRKAQIGPVYKGAGDLCALHDRGQTGFDGFNYGKFGHNVPS